MPIPTRSDEDATRVSDAVERRAARAGRGWAFAPRPTGPTSGRAGSSTSGSSRACRCASRSGRAICSSDQVTLVRRDTRAKEQVAWRRRRAHRRSCSSRCSKRLFDRARGISRGEHPRRRGLRHLQAASCRSSAVSSGPTGAAVAECEGRIKEETRATIRVIPEDAEAAGPGTCVLDGPPATRQALFAQSY